MALPKLFQRIFFHNNTNPALNEDNFNAMSKGLSDVDDRVIGLAGTIMEDVPQIQEDIEELEADMALIDTKIASATAEANRATTAANNAAASVISAGNKALVSEGWAKGTQNGAAVGSTSPYYHNNAEYFKNQARSFTPQGYQDLVDDVDSLKETLTNFEESITGDVIDSEPYVLRQGLGNLADMSLVGGSVAWNQLIKNGNFASTSNWAATRATMSASSNELTVTGTGDNGFVAQNLSFVTGHKYLLSVEAKASAVNNAKRLISIYYGLWNDVQNIYCTSTSYQRYSLLFVPTDGTDANTLRLYADGSTYVNKFKNANLFDLTQMFGPTIADYIYALEQATAGAGVAWFRKYFPNVYYAYNAGSLQHVNPSARKAVGKNLISGVENGSWDNDTQQKISGISRARIANIIRVEPLKRYTFSITTESGYVTKVKVDSYNGLGSGTFISSSDWQDVPFTYTAPSNALYVTIEYGFVVTTHNPEKYTSNAQFEIGTTATEYTPYVSAEFPFANIQLRGVPKLVDNKLSYDGDIYTADGTVTRKYGIVDLGTLTWTASGAATGLYKTDSLQASIKKGGAILISSKYTVTNLPYDEMPDKSISTNVAGYSESKLVLIKDSTVADATALTTALSGVYLVYELATPTTESADPYQNPQRAFTEGTEEFVDYGVQSATRDVSIPVGNNTTYQLNETLPPTEDYVDGALKFKVAISALGTDESGRTTASRAYTTGEFFYKDGKMYKVLTSIASGATFTVGTNCQQTTLFAELKALAQ